MWSQNYDDVDIKVPVTKDVTKGKQVRYDNRHFISEFFVHFFVPIIVYLNRVRYGCVPDFNT